MKVKIEDYRGFEISFDVDDEVFYCMDSARDTETTKKTFAAVKTWIDNYIKDNEPFKPFKLMRFERHYKNGGEITISGIRKDGRFTFIDKQGKLKQLAEYDETDWYLPNEANEPIMKEIADVRTQISTLRDKEKELEAKLIKVDFKSVRTKYIPQ
jgi:hypothetical protein